MTFIIIIVIGAFLYWSLVPAKPRNLNDAINDAQKRNGQYSNVYIDYKLNKILGPVHYIGIQPNDLNDKKVFSGTLNECENYIARRV